MNKKMFNKLMTELFKERKGDTNMSNYIKYHRIADRYKVSVDYEANSFDEKGRGLDYEWTVTLKFTGNPYYLLDRKWAYEKYVKPLLDKLGITCYYQEQDYKYIEIE